jgi:TatD DNase family protein
MFANTHAHLRAFYLSGELDAVIKRATENGLELILNAGIDLQSSIDAAKVAKNYDIVYACVGIHPWNADKLYQETKTKLRDLTREEKVVAVSEIGLDFVSKRDLVAQSTSVPLPKQLQVETFQNQIKLAKDVKLPIFLHDNAAHLEVLEILKQENASEIGGAIHGFNGDLTLAKECIDLGFCISIGKAILTPENVILQSVVKEIPITKLLIETDGGDPSDVTKVAYKVAELKGISLEQVGRTTTSTLRTILKI